MVWPKWELDATAPQHHAWSLLENILAGIRLARAVSRPSHLSGNETGNAASDVVLVRRLHMTAM